MKFRRYISILSVLVILAGFMPAYTSAGALTAWEDRSVPLPVGERLNSVAYGNGMFVAVGSAGNVMTSVNGENWESHALGTSINLKSVVYGGSSNEGVFVAVGDEGAIVTSINGKEWDAQTSNTDDYLTSVAYGGGTFTAVGEDGGVLTSRDGIGWESQSLDGHAFFGVTYGAGGKYVAVGEYEYSASVTTLDDKNQWHTYKIERGKLSGVAYGNGMYVAVGTLPDFVGGIVVTSKDGEAWVREQSAEMPYAIAYGNGTFVAIDFETIFTSTDGKNWSKQLGTQGGFQGVAYGNGSFVVVGNDGTILQSYVKYTVAYDDNGSTGGSVPTDNGTYDQENEVAVLENTGSLVRTGYTFAGWNTKADGNGTDYAPGATFKMGAKDVTLYAKWISGNASLSGLTLPAVTLSPAFAADTTAYTAKVPNGVSAITVTTTPADANATVTASVYNNGMLTSGPHVLTNGAASPPLSLSVGSNTIQLAVKAQDGTTKIYEVMITRESGSNTPPSPKPDSTGSSPSSNSSSSNNLNSTAKPSEFRILINGKEQEGIAASATSQGNGHNVFTVSVDAGKLAAQLAKEKDKPSVAVIVMRGADKVTAALTGDIVKTLENKKAILEFRTLNGGFKLSAEEIGVDRMAKQLEANVPLADVVVRADILKSDAAKTALLDTAATQRKFTVIAATTVDMAITASYGGKTAKSDKFDSYVEREIPLPDGIDGSKVTTAVMLNENGTVHHVPTRMTTRDGKPFAVVNSLTNGTLALIWRPIAFADVEGHWAKDAVNGMASRMVVNGIDSEHYDPDAAISRAEFAAIIVRALGLDDNGARENATFMDVKSADWFSSAVAKAGEYGMVNGYEDGTFRPAQTITREEATAMMMRAIKLAEIQNSMESAAAEAILASFPDGVAVSAWAKEAVAAAVKSGLFQGSTAGLLPKNDITRAETAAMVQRLLEKAKLIDNNKN